MTQPQLPISERDISALIKRQVKSPILVSNLANLGLNEDDFLKMYTDFFEELPWDQYDPRRLQIEFLKSTFPDDAHEIHGLFKDYFTGTKDRSILDKWISKLDANQVEKFEAIQPWRRRSVSQFVIEVTETGGIVIQREPVPQFAQGLDDSDFRSWPRVFAESPSNHVDNMEFMGLIGAVFQNIIRNIQPEVKRVRMVAHFMSVKSTKAVPGDNSPEGAHEDGADFIISALVINRKNVVGGETQIIEQYQDGSRDTIFKRILAPGEFCFQADTGEEKIYGNDLWHHVTPFFIEDIDNGEGWRDIIGFDINIEV